LGAKPPSCADCARRAVRRISGRRVERATGRGRRGPRPCRQQGPSEQAVPSGASWRATSRGGPPHGDRVVEPLRRSDRMPALGAARRRDERVALRPAVPPTRAPGRPAHQAGAVQARVERAGPTHRPNVCRPFRRRGRGPRSPRASGPGISCEVPARTGVPAPARPTPRSVDGAPRDPPDVQRRQAARVHRRGGRDGLAMGSCGGAVCQRAVRVLRDDAEAVRASGSPRRRRWDGRDPAASSWATPRSRGLR
jgi:hypothetical protein